MDLEKLTAASILEDGIFCEIIEEKDEVFRQRIIFDLTDRAKMLNVKEKFEKLLKAFFKIEKNELVAARTQKPVQESFQNWTKFSVGEKYPELFCGNWIADNTGVRTFTMFGECLACYHPILPTERLTNLETGTEKIKLAFLKGKKWREITVEKELMSSTTKIVSLSNLGVAVTSETAKYLVKYLSDVENYNIDIIPERLSTSKMGWIGGEFMPYNDNVLFDGNGRFEETFKSIREQGSWDEWLSLVLKIRATKRIEPKMFLAASFASVLVKICDALPFIVNMWGETEGGKTVSLMLATSVWADPSGNKYIADFKTTDVALEVRMNFLNNFPLMIDDTATVKERFKDNFSSFIYDLCSGKGKSRSNRNLGINKENSWKNIILSTGEHPLSNEKLQGGAINRILDLEVGETAIYESGQSVVSTLSNNFGFAGRKFIEVISELGDEYIRNLQQEFLKDIQKAEKMEKQSISLSIIMAADKIATEHIFCDGEYIDLPSAETVLIDRNELSENERCYDYVLGEVAVNSNKFTTNSFGEYQNEVWGAIQGDHGDYVAIFNNVFERICKSGGYSYKAFLSWADRKGLLQTASGRKTKQRRINGNHAWCVVLKLKQESSDFEKKSYEEEVF